LAKKIVIEDQKEIEILENEVSLTSVNSLIKERLLQESRRLALLHEYDRSIVKLQITKEKHLEICISKKGRQLADQLEAIIESPKDENSNELGLVIRDACDLYLWLFYEGFKEQISGLPHLSALFYNDTQYFSHLFLFHFPDPIHTHTVLDWQTRASHVLDRQITKQKQEILTILGEGDMDISVLRKLSDQALMKISHVSRTLLTVLDKAVFEAIYSEMVYGLVNWVWVFVMGLTEISTEECAALESWWTSITALDSSNSSLDDPRIKELFMKLHKYQDILSMSLLQFTNSHRKGLFEGILTPRELVNIIDAMYKDSPSKRALITEISMDFE